MFPYTAHRSRNSLVLLHSLSSLVYSVVSSDPSGEEVQANKSPYIRTPSNPPCALSYQLPDSPRNEKQKLLVVRVADRAVEHWQSVESKTAIFTASKPTQAKLHRPAQSGTDPKPRARRM